MGKRYKHSIAVPEKSEAGLQAIRRISTDFCYLSLTGVVPRMPGAFVPKMGDARLIIIFFGGIYEHTNPFHIIRILNLPTQWYNIAADSPVPPTPVLHPGTLEPVTPDFLSVIFPMPLIEQEISSERYIDIPDEIREIYKLWRPTPLLRAVRLEKALGTPAHIYYKVEGVSPSGSHKSNTAVAQAYYNKIAGTKAMTTETGAGQWGTALSMACAMFGMDLEVFMVRVSYDQKPYRRMVMETYGANVFSSPSQTDDECGRNTLAVHPDHPGTLGVAISEAVEVAVLSNGTKKYGLGFGS